MGLGFPSKNIPVLLKAAATNTAASYKAVPGISASVTAAATLAVKRAYVSAFRTTYLVAIAFGCAAIIAAFCTQNIDRSTKTSNRAVRLENEEKTSKEVDL